ncbi:type II secretion system protein [Caldifermentibacillus hisashii]|uniref:type II secretion system protein n=1 Tax=Bacillaceae TaxID=186817 RepID=UPI00203C63C5|nr:MULTISPECIES: type II secretion system protein [Bacillaceae]MCM3478155.1 type II secretion system GspH family protein [Caldibacillus thermoamylovorans]
MENKRIKKFKNSSGVTLFEILAGVVILGIVFTLVGHLLSTVQKQYTIQNEQIEQQRNLKLAIQNITKDIRKENLVSIPEKNVLVIGESSNGIRYELKDAMLQRNGITVVSNISKLKIIGLTQDDRELLTGESSEIIGIKLEITTTANQMGTTETLSSTVYLRME